MNKVLMLTLACVLVIGLASCSPNPPVIPLSDLTIEGTTIVAYNGKAREITIPAKNADGEPIVKIGDNAFRRKTLLKVVLHKNITTIGVNAFTRNALTSIVIPDSVTNLATAAFQNNRLTSVTLGTGITALSDSVFEKNKLTTLTIPSSITRIGYKTFYENPLESMTVNAKTPPSIAISLPHLESFDHRIAKLYVPFGTANIYSDSDWGRVFISVTENKQTPE